MPLFFNLDLIHEAEDDQEPTDYTAAGAGGDDTTADTGTQDNNDTGNDNAGNDQPDDNPEDAPEDYTVPDDDENQDNDNPEDAGDDNGDDNTDEGEDDTPADDTTDTDDSSMSDDTDDGDNKIKEIQDQIFQDLTSGQLKIKNKELKKRYFDMYENISALIDKVNDVPKIDETIQILGFVSNKLDELASMISDYLNDTYDTLTYIENEINFQKFIGTMNGINSVLDNLSEYLSKKEKKNDDE